jgi:hypothetical protein
MVCPVCTVAVGAGVVAFRQWGIDDVITGIWIGALIVSSIAWMIDYLNKKNIHFLFRKILIIVSFYLLFLFPLYKPMNIIGIAGNVLFGLDKIILGVILGTFLFIISVLADLGLKKLNDGKLVIYYQRVFIPLIILLIASFDIHMLLKLI